MKVCKDCGTPESSYKHEYDLDCNCGGVFVEILPKDCKFEPGYTYTPAYDAGNRIIGWTREEVKQNDTDTNKEEN